MGNEINKKFDGKTSGKNRVYTPQSDPSKARLSDYFNCDPERNPSRSPDLNSEQRPTEDRNSTFFYNNPRDPPYSDEFFVGRKVRYSKFLGVVSRIDFDRQDPLIVVDFREFTGKEDSILELPVKKRLY
jgi:hypothetical protein